MQVEGAHVCVGILLAILVGFVEDGTSALH